jgi:hypothetical protein
MKQNQQPIPEKPVQKKIGVSWYPPTARAICGAKTETQTKSFRYL